MSRTIYTHDEAARIVELFEDILAKYDIYVPSPEDSERDIEDLTGLYGTTYWDLLDDVESQLCDILGEHKPGTKVVTGVFSGNS